MTAEWKYRVDQDGSAAWQVVEHPVLGPLYHVEVQFSVDSGVFELQLTDLVNDKVVDLNTFMLDA